LAIALLSLLLAQKSVELPEQLGTMSATTLTSSSRVTNAIAPQIAAMKARLLVRH
jgi:hypothetical protein